MKALRLTPLHDCLGFDGFVWFHAHCTVSLSTDYIWILELARYDVAWRAMVHGETISSCWSRFKLQGLYNAFWSNSFWHALQT